MRREWVALCGLAVGCSRSSWPFDRPSGDGTVPVPVAASAEPSPPEESIAELEASARASPAPVLPDRGVVAARAVGLWYGKPPLKVHRFDVVLRNPASEPRWMVLPTTFPYKNDTVPAPGDRGVTELQIFRLSAQPHVLIAEAVGGTFWAVKLPAGGHVTLRRLAIESWWQEVPASVVLQVLVAREITVGGQRLGSLVGEEALSESGADVLAPKDGTDPRELPFWHAEGDKSAPLKIDVASRAQVTVPLR